LEPRQSDDPPNRNEFLGLLLRCDSRYNVDQWHEAGLVLVACEFNLRERPSSVNPNFGRLGFDQLS
jgi:hypothetical protein